MRADDALNGSVETARLRAVAATDFARDSRELERASGERDPGRTAAAFESLLARMVVKELRRGLGEGFFGTGSGADVYGGWLDEHLGESLASSGSLGIAGMVKAALGAPSVPAEPDANDAPDVPDPVESLRRPAASPHRGEESRT